uniref:Uncharacterized protein n=1 Tax=Anopheles epiroticus TaxID=199890 RepID=A0A182P8L5_9DIPT
MVLSALGNFIHHFYLLLYYTFRVTTIIGSLLYDTIVKVTHSVYWCAQNVTVFFRIVYEDNHNLIRDANAIITGTSTYFYRIFVFVVEQT